jgi:arylsulfatase A-like enzyme
MKFSGLLPLVLALYPVNLQAQQPNILFIAVDDLNDYVNIMEGPIKAHTPNIDRLASQGTLFTNAHCQAPICGPSRASVMTGFYPSSTGNYLQVEDGNINKANELSREAVFMPQFFEQHGYKTMAVGKIYHNGDRAETFGEYGGGFDWFGPFPEERFNYDPSKIEGKIGGTLTDWGAYPAHDSLMPDYKYARWAVNKLHESHEKPFFMAVGFIRPHVPWYAPQKWFDMFPLDSIKTPPYNENDFDDIPAMARRVNNAPMMPTTEELIQNGQWEEVIQAYLACVAFVDAQIGKVLDALEESEYANNTIVVLWSDHGYHVGEKNRVAKQSLWERDSRSLLLFKDIKGDGGKVCNKPVQLMDIYPTLVELSNLPPYQLAEGNSLAGLIHNPDQYWPHTALTFYGIGNIAIRNDQYRLIQYEDGSQELYDMFADPYEWTNLANSRKHRKIIRKLQKSIPKEWSENSPYSRYDFNEYFIERYGKHK